MTTSSPADTLHHRICPLSEACCGLRVGGSGEHLGSSFVIGARTLIPLLLLLLLLLGAARCRARLLLLLL